MKLAATYLNGIAVSTFAIGALAPIVGIVAGRLSTPVWIVAALFFASLGLSVLLHYLASRVLRRLYR
ncbi:MAG: hypothetical protein ACFBWO_00635 [Paracoccaceae bacterium]